MSDNQKPIATIHWFDSRLECWLQSPQYRPGHVEMSVGFLREWRERFYIEWLDTTNPS